MPLSEFAKLLGIKRDIAEDALHSEQVARLVLSRRTMLIGTAVAAALLCTRRASSEGGLAIPALFIPAIRKRIIEGVLLLAGDSVTMNVNPLYPNGAPVPVEEKWALLKRHQATYGGVFIEFSSPPKPLTPEELGYSKKLREEVAADSVVNDDDPDEPCMNCALPGYESPFEPDREDCQACHGTGRCPESVNENPPKQYKTAKRAKL